MISSAVVSSHKTTFEPLKFEKYSVKLTFSETSSVSPLPPVVPSNKIKDLTAMVEVIGNNMKDFVTT